MDSERFDILTRSLTTPRTRRSLARLLGALSLGSILSAQTVREAAAAKRTGGAPCRKGSQCKTGKCVGPAGSKTCSCSKKFPKCMTPTDGSSTICCQGACIAGDCCDNTDCTLPDTCAGGGKANVCGNTNCGAGGPCPAGADCFNGVCECRHHACSTGDNGDCTLGEVCNDASSAIRCCCGPNGNTLLDCTPGPNAICCSGFCNANHVCAEPPT